MVVFSGCMSALPALQSTTLSNMYLLDRTSCYFSGVIFCCFDYACVCVALSLLLAFELRQLF